MQPRERHDRLGREALGAKALAVGPTHFVVQRYALSGEPVEDLADALPRHGGEDALDLADRV